MTPQETDPDLSVSVQKSLAEAWVGGGLLQVGGTECSSACKGPFFFFPAWDLLKEVTIVFITSTIVWPQVK